MDIKQKKEVTRTESVIVGKTCDYCGSEIKVWNLIKSDNPYFAITTGHHRWGNDSDASRRTTDACCVECLKVAFEKYCADKGYDSYIEIEKHRFTTE